MATEKEITDIIIRPMLTLYRPPQGMDDNEDRMRLLRTQFIRALVGFDATILVRAWDRVVARHYGWEWPTLQEIIREANLCS